MLHTSLDYEYFFDDGFDESLGVFVAIGSPFDEYVANAGGAYLLLGHLDLSAALLLQLSDGLSALADDQSHTFVGDRDDVGLLSYLDLTLGLGGPYGVNNDSSIYTRSPTT